MSKKRNKNRGFSAIQASIGLVFSGILIWGFSGCTMDFPLSLLEDRDGTVDAADIDAADIDASDIDAADIDASDIDASEIDASEIDAADIDAADIDAGEDCGDGVLDIGEGCDDENNDDGDGCSATCTVEPGYTCTGEPSDCVTECGDGVVAGDEACDDGNQEVGDGCNNDCEVDCANESTEDCNPVGETLNPAAAFVDQEPPAGFVQCAGFANTSDNDVAADWEANCLGALRTLRVRYWDTNVQPWQLLGDATLDPAREAAYAEQKLDAVNHAGTEGFFATQGVTFLKDDPSSPTPSEHVCNPSHPSKEYGATDFYFGNEADDQTVMVCGYSAGDSGDAPCTDDWEIMAVPTDYSQSDGCGNQTGVSRIAVAIYYEL